MGYGGYSVLTSRARAVDTYAHYTKEQNFKERKLNPAMSPYNLNYREALDSEEHPESFPIIIGLDETGSMGRIPNHLISSLLPNIMEKVQNAGIKDPAICFCGIGDAQDCIEGGPIQVGQFESKDELMEKWLSKIWLEGQGGGNGGESYNLVWYFAARHTKIDSWDKRKVKGCLITIGDEPCHKYIPREAIKKYFGEIVSEDITTSQILKEAKERWNIWHIHCDGSKTYDFDETNWGQLLGDHVRISQDVNADDLDKLIPKIIIRCYNGEDSVEAGR